MAKVLYIKYSNNLLEDFIDFWNTSFADRRNFLKATLERIWDRCFGRKDFDLEGMFLAVQGEEIVGMGHAGFPTPIGVHAKTDQSVGVIHLLYVSARSRGHGIGSHLLDLCEEYLRGAKCILIGIRTGKDGTLTMGQDRGLYCPFGGRVKESESPQRILRQSSSFSTGVSRYLAKPSACSPT